MNGLTQAEVDARRARGEGNEAQIDGGRSYWDILRTNLFSFFNNILYTIGILLVTLGQTTDALLSVGLGIFNAVVGTFQEIRAKRQLDQVALLNQPQVTVVRDSKEQSIRPHELVLGDVVVLRAGEQALVDGRIVSRTTVEMDEALLTGETDLIIKQEGDQILSGSFCVTGQGYYEVEKVGSESFANQITATARTFEVRLTPLQRKVNFVVRLLMLIVVIMSLVIFAAAIIEGLRFSRLVEMAAVLTGLVPYGLFTMIVVAYALGASKIAQRGALVQQTNAIESLSNIDVLCMDKTGTLTTNNLTFEAIAPLNKSLSSEEIGGQLGTFLASVSTPNKTGQAIADGLSKINGDVSRPQTILDEISFASVRKWSALAFESGVYVMGAIEMLASYLPADATAPDSALQQQAKAWSERGLRVLLFAANMETTTLHDGETILLPPLTPLALICLRDELRPFAAETMAAFESLGIDLKIISGDNPRTVAALAKQAGMKNTQLVSGSELENCSASELRDIVNETMVFGRITPEQKQALVEALIQQGHYVAMMGDGVNDVLSLKKAQIGIAMQSGSQATRNVADMVLMQDSFVALQPAFGEGKKIVGGLMRSMYLFIARVVSSALIIIGISMMGLSFPFEPAQVALTLFTIGIPAFFLTLWAQPLRLEGDILHSVVRFVVPTAILSMLFGLIVYTSTNYFMLNTISNVNVPPRVVERFEAYTGLTYNVDEEFSTAAATIVAQSHLSIFISYAAFILLLFLEPAHRWLEGWTTRSEQRWPFWLAVVLWVIFTIVVVWEPSSSYFGLVRIPFRFLMAIWAAVLLWALLLRYLWRSSWFDQVFGI